jgi:undecaprenyl-diphosphatase
MDETILRALNASTEAPVIAAIMVFLSSPWMLLSTTAPLAIILIRKKRFLALAAIVVAMSAADAVNARLIKPTFDRERPCRAMAELVLPVKCGSGRSFASGHSAVAFAFAISASPSVRFGWYIFPFLALMVALSRVFLGAHYPSDITAGGLFGASVAALVLLGKKLLEKRLTERKKATAPSPSLPDPPATNEPTGPAP